MMQFNNDSLRLQAHIAKLEAGAKLANLVL